MSWAAGLLPTPPMGVLTGVPGAVRPTGQLRGLAQEKRSQYKAGRPTKYSTRLLNNTTHTHTSTHTQGCAMGLINVLGTAA